MRETLYGKFEIDVDNGIVKVPNFECLKGKNVEVAERLMDELNQAYYRVMSETRH